MPASALHCPNVSESHTVALHPHMPGVHPILLSAPLAPTASASRGPVLPGSPPPPRLFTRPISHSVGLSLGLAPKYILKIPRQAQDALRNCGQPCERAPLPPPFSLDCKQRAVFFLLTVLPSYPAVTAT